MVLDARIAARTGAAVLIDLADATPTTSGGKAAPLAQLLMAGLPVPPGFVVPTHAYEEAIAGVDIAGAARHDADAARLLVEQATLTPTLVVEISTALTRVTDASSDGCVAVRSSATCEDGADAAAAGQYDTFLGVRGPDQVADAVRRCWASLWSKRAVAYRRRQPGDVSADPPLIAVLVQRLVDADVAGVLFTGTTIRIEASWGLGESIVDGQVTPDSWVVTDGAIVHRAVGRVLRADAGVDCCRRRPPGSGRSSRVWLGTVAPTNGQDWPDAELRVRSPLRAAGLAERGRETAGYGAPRHRRQRSGRGCRLGRRCGSHPRKPSTTRGCSGAARSGRASVLPVSRVGEATMPRVVPDELRAQPADLSAGYQRGCYPDALRSPPSKRAGTCSRTRATTRTDRGEPQWATDAPDSRAGPHGAQKATTGPRSPRGRHHRALTRPRRAPRQRQCRPSLRVRETRRSAPPVPCQVDAAEPAGVWAARASSTARRWCGSRSWPAIAENSASNGSSTPVAMPLSVSRTARPQNGTYAGE